MPLKNSFIYKPQEDSALLEKYVKTYAKGRVLDIGTGSGIQAIAAAQNSNVASVLATDIQKKAIEHCKKNIKNTKIKFLQSDLFKKIKGKFDTIIFNPPYLPQELKLRDLTIEGGEKGYEIMQKFICEVNKFLSEDGIVLMVFSSLTKKEKVEEFIKNSLLDFKELEKLHIFFEDIYVYLLRKNDLLRQLEKRGIKNVKYLAKGHRGLLFTGFYKNRKAAIKSKNPQSTAVNRIENEAKWIKLLNRHNIGPRLLISNKDYFVYRYIDGDFIIDAIKKSDKIKIKKLIRNIFSQMSALDKLKVDKEEMHRPLKHIIIKKDKPYLIDFERARHAQNPKNVTQFCQFLMSGRMRNILANKDIKFDRLALIRLAKVYKSKQTLKNFKDILKLFQYEG